MCANCGCQRGANTTVLNLQTGMKAEIATEHDALHSRTHVHADGTRHSHGDDHSHSHDHAADMHSHDRDHLRAHDHSPGARRRGHSHRHNETQAHAGGVLDIETRILAKNDALAQRNRAWLSGREVLALNLVSSPGAGKTTLLERTIAALAVELPLFVIEGDQATANDGERIRNAGAPVVQVNTGTGCHLDAEMVAHGFSELKPT